MGVIENANPKLYKKSDERNVTPGEEDENVVDEFDSREVFGILFEYITNAVRKTQIKHNLINVDSARLSDCSVFFAILIFQNIALIM